MVCISKITEDLAGRVENECLNKTALFSMLPVKIPAKTFTHLNAAIGTFLWQNKKARISYKKLQLFKELGGLGLPNLKSYYWAAQLNHIASWIQQPKDLSWLENESQYCDMPL